MGNWPGFRPDSMGPLPDPNIDKTKSELKQIDKYITMWPLRFFCGSGIRCFITTNLVVGNCMVFRRDPMGPLPDPNRKNTVTN